MILYGKNSVLERLKANPSSIKRVLLHTDFDVPEIQQLIQAHKIPEERLNPKELDKIKSNKDNQGIIAKVGDFKYADFDDLLSTAKDKKLTFIFLDRLTDPHNLGAIIRTAACFGSFAVIIPKFKACEVTEAVLHVASGGENYVPIALVSNLSNAIISAKQAGFWIMGTAVDEGSQDITNISIPFPLGLVLGSEGEGVGHSVQKRFDIQARIPMKGAELSFNVAQSCAIFCYEIARQRKGIK